MAQRRFPRWPFWIGIPLVLVALVIAFWSWDWFIPLAERQASAALGRKVTIAHLHVRLGRVTEVVVDDLRVANPDGFEAEEPFAQVPRTTVLVDVMEYWHHRAIVIPSVTVERPQVAALAHADGRTNYAFDFGKPAGEDAPKQDKTASAPRIGVLRIVDGHAHVVNPALKADFQLGIATRDEETQDPRIAVTADGTYAGQRITGQALAGGPAYLQDQSRPWPIEMQLANGPTNVSLKGTVRDPLAMQGADVNLVLQGPDMALLQPLTGIPFARTPNYRIAGHLDYADGRVRFRDFDGRVGSSDLSGTIAVTTGGAKPQVEANLHSKQVDLADLGGFIGETPGRASTPGQSAQQRRELARNERSSRMLPDTPVSLPKLNMADVKLNYHADSIRGRQIPFDGMAVDMTIADGAVRLSPVSFAVGKGRIAGEIALTPQENGALGARADVQFQRVDLSRLMQPTGFQGSGLIGGRAVIDGTGKSLAEILGSGNGSLTLTMAGGGNLSALLVDLSGLRLGNAILSFLKLPDRTQVECFVGDFTLRRGVLNTRALLVDTEDVLISGKGTVDLGREKLDYSLRSDSKHFTVGQLPAPIVVGGTFRDPSVGIDPTEGGIRAGAAVGLGFLAAPLAILPTIQFGIGDDNRCESLIARGRKAG